MFTPQYWCEDVKPPLWDALRRKGWWLLFTANKVFTYSRKELVKLKARLPHDLVQGKGFIDAVAVKDGEGLVAAAESRDMAWLNRVEVEELRRLFIEAIYGPPDDVARAYEELRSKWGFKLPAWRAGRMYKSLIIAWGNNRVRNNAAKGLTAVAIIPFYAPQETRSYTQSALEKLAEYMESQHGVKVKPAIATYKPTLSKDTGRPTRIAFAGLSGVDLDVEVEDVEPYYVKLKGCSACQYREECWARLRGTQG